MRGVKGPPEPEDLPRRPSASRAARPAPSPAPFRHLRRSSQRPVSSLIRKGVPGMRNAAGSRGKGGRKTRAMGASRGLPARGPLRRPAPQPPPPARTVPFPFPSDAATGVTGTSLIEIADAIPGRGGGGGKGGRWGPPAPAPLAVRTSPVHPPAPAMDFWARRGQVEMMISSWINLKHAPVRVRSPGRGRGPWQVDPEARRRGDGGSFFSRAPSPHHHHPPRRSGVVETNPKTHGYLDFTRSAKLSPPRRVCHRRTRSMSFSGRPPPTGGARRGVRAAVSPPAAQRKPYVSR